MLVFTLITLFILIVFNILFLSVPLEVNHSDGAIVNYNKFSILIAAKNEAGNLPFLIHSLKKIDYPREHFEIILINDNSSDATGEIAREHAENFNNLFVVDASNKQIPGKKGALQIGLNFARFPFIITTDADCIVPPDWLNEINMHFNNGADVIIGFQKYVNLKSFFKKYTAFESLRNQLLLFSLGKINLPYSAIGTNFAFRKRIYEKMGGYSAISQTLSGDDDLLLQKALKLKANIAIMFSKNSLVKTYPPVNIKNLINQRSRHVTTSFYYNFRSVVLLSLWHLTNIVAFYSIFPGLFNSVFLPIFFVKFLLDSLTILRFRKQWNYNFKFAEILIFQAIYEIMIPFYFLKAKFGEIRWK